MTLCITLVAPKHTSDIKILHTYKLGGNTSHFIHFFTPTLLKLSYINFMVHGVSFHHMVTGEHQRVHRDNSV